MRILRKDRHFPLEKNLFLLQKPSVAKIRGELYRHAFQLSENYHVFEANTHQAPSRFKAIKFPPRKYKSRKRASSIILEPAISNRPTR